MALLNNRINNFLQKGLFFRKAFFVFILFSLSLLVISFFPVKNRVLLDLESSTLDNGKVVIVKAQILFDQESDKMISHYHYPREYYFFNNSFGEAKIYDPNSNSVMVKYGKEYSSSSSFLYSFFNGQQNDLSFAEKGFQLQKSYYEGNYLITEWIPPTHFLKLFTDVKLVTENDFPVYCEYTKDQENFFQKIFFSDYLELEYTKIPTRIVQIGFDTKQDSSINRILLKNIKTGTSIGEDLAGFIIPEDAVIAD